MSQTPFSWRLDGPLDRLTWHAVVPQGHYEINHRTLAARFIRTEPAAAVEVIDHPHTNLEEAQRFCEQHWKILVRKGSDSSSRRRSISAYPKR